MDYAFQQIEHNKLLISIPKADSINHVVLFLTGAVQLPAGLAACIFFSLPDPAAPPTWNYLGYLTNEKPSAIYRITNLAKCQLRAESDLSKATNPAFNYVQEPVVHLAQIGISLEPVDAVLQMVPALDNSASNVSQFAEFINKTVSNLYNYCSSFSRPANDLLGNPFQSNGLANNTQFIPLSTLQTWYENYTRRLSNDQNFWKSLS